VYFSVYRVEDNLLVLMEVVFWNFHVFMKLSFEDCQKIFIST